MPTDSGVLKRRETVKRHRDKLIAAGLCVSCRQPNDRPTQRCFACTTKTVVANRELKRKKREEFREAGLTSDGKQPKINLPSTSTADRLWPFVDKNGPNGCWLWTRCTTHGYGRVTAGDGVTMGSHVLAWILTNGDIPDGLYVCHNCPGGDNPLCCNPAHLFLGTQKDNMQDAAKKDRTTHGSKNPMAKLTEDLVKELLIFAETHTQEETAIHFNVSRPNVSMILGGKSWQRVSRRNGSAFQNPPATQLTLFEEPANAPR